MYLLTATLDTTSLSEERNAFVLIDNGQPKITEEESTEINFRKLH